MVTFVNFFLASLFVSLGIAGGYFAGRIAEEELKTGEKYFRILGQFILVLILLFFLYAWQVDKVLQFVLFAVVLAFFAAVKIRKIKIPTFGTKWLYALFGVLFYLSIDGLFLLIGSLILIYGFPVGTLFYFKKEKKWQIVFPMIIFIGVSNILYIMF